MDAGAEPVFAFYLGNQVNEELTIGGVTSAHYTGDFAYTNLESTSYWQVNLDGLKLNGATPYAIVDAGTSLLAGPTTDVKSIAAWLSLSTTIFSSLEYSVVRSVADTDAYIVGETVHGHREESCVKNPQHRRPESLCRVKVNLFHVFTARGFVFQNRSRPRTQRMSLTQSCSRVAGNAGCFQPSHASFTQNQVRPMGLCLDHNPPASIGYGGFSSR